ncbi:NADH-cytochrome b5 reductase [Actinomortierella ambigua]|uniref:NADH-cytochrome b5 reductase n=1 Tax=Actinomortierella ambigua TaxID=1343610 RepID=A0A9P6Q6F2_9FUNG|nr:NADH-cytochrome b5 reductase [Actinomortierella ambigua]
MFSAIANPLRANARIMAKHAYSTSAGSSSGSSKLLTIGVPTVAAAAAAYYFFSPQSTATESKGKKDAPAPPAAAAAAAVAAAKTALNPKDFVDFKLRKVEKLTHNTSRFIFDLEKDQKLGLDTASCVVTRFSGPDGKLIIRPYTPTTDADLTGEFDLVVKRYEGGPMSSHIHSLKPGDVLSIKGPISKYPMDRNKHEKIGMIAGGSGITPMFQVIQHLLKDKEDKTEISLIFANVTPDDIIMKEEIDALAKANPTRFKVTYLVDKAADGWKGPTGFVTKELIKEHMPGHEQGNTKVMVCGPPGMMKAVCGVKGPNFTQGEVDGALKELGYDSEHVFKF